MLGALILRLYSMLSRDLASDFRSCPVRAGASSDRSTLLCALSISLQGRLRVRGRQPFRPELGVADLRPQLVHDDLPLFVHLVDPPREVLLPAAGPGSFSPRSLPSSLSGACRVPRSWILLPFPRCTAR